jgi:hypothetical protein
MRIGVGVDRRHAGAGQLDALAPDRRDVCDEASGIFQRAQRLGDCVEAVSRIEDTK